MEQTMLDWCTRPDATSNAEEARMLESVASFVANLLEQANKSIQHLTEAAAQAARHKDAKAK